MSLATTRIGRTTPPNLERDFYRIPSVPVFRSHVRKIERDGQVQELVVDKTHLQSIAENTNRRASKQEYPLVRVGHVIKGAPETDQPPPVGYLRNLALGKFDDDYAVLSDMYIDKRARIALSDGRILEGEEILRSFPRRSVESFFTREKNGYIDAVALLNRAPELDLGLVTHFSKSSDVEVFECNCDHDDDDDDKDDDMAEDNDDDLDDDFDDDEDDALDRPNSLNETSDEEGEGEEGVSEMDRLVSNMIDKLVNHPKMGELLAKAHPQLVETLLKRLSELFEAHAEKEEDGNGESDEDRNQRMDARPQNTTQVSQGDPASQGNPESYQRNGHMDKPTNEGEPTTLESALVQIANQGMIITRLEKTIEELQTFAKDTTAQSQSTMRRAQLEKLAMSYDFDVDSSLEAYSKASSEEWDRFIALVPNFRPKQSHERNGFIPVAPNPRLEPHSAEPDYYARELTEAEVATGALESFAREQKLELGSVQQAGKVLEAYFSAEDRDSRRKAAEKRYERLKVSQAVALASRADRR